MLWWKIKIRKNAAEPLCNHKNISYDELLRFQCNKYLGEIVADQTAEASVADQTAEALPLKDLSKNCGRKIC